MKSAFLTPLASIPACLTELVLVTRGKRSSKIEARYAVATYCQPDEAARAVEALSIRGGSFVTAKGHDIGRMDGDFVSVVDGVTVRESNLSGYREIAALAANGTVCAVASRQKDVTRWACYGPNNGSKPGLLTKTRKVALAFIVNAARKASNHA